MNNQEAAKKGIEGLVDRIRDLEAKLTTANGLIEELKQDLIQIESLNELEEWRVARDALIKIKEWRGK